jgi:hypothetical protein
MQPLHFAGLRSHLHGIRGTRAHLASSIALRPQGSPLSN